MNETEQFNIRLSKSLIDDLEFIARASQITKSEWVRYNVSELVKKAKEKLLRDVEKEFILDRKSAKEYQEVVGYLPSEELRAKREAYHKKMIELVRDQAHKEFAAKALLQGAPKTEKRDNVQDRRRVWGE